MWRNISMVRVRSRCNRLLACLAVVVALIALFALASCGKRSLVNQLSDTRDRLLRATAEDSAVLALPTPENGFGTDGLTPGEDYYPDRIVVSFKRGAKGSSQTTEVS